MVSLIFGSLAHFQFSKRGIEGSQISAREPSLSAHENDGKPVHLRKTAFPSAAAVAASGRPSASKDSQDKKAVDVETSKGAALFHYLFEASFDQKLNTAVLAKIQNRFAEPYPAHTMGHVSPHRKEMTNRLGILKAMGEEVKPFKLSKTLRNQLGNFYVEILSSNEHFLLKRQALRNLNSLQLSKSEGEMKDLYAQLDNRILATAGFDDHELVSAILSEQGMSWASQRSQQEAGPETLSYDVLPCPTESQFQEYVKDLSISLPEGASFDQHCGNDERAKLAKLLLYLRGMTFDFPASWPEFLKKDLEDGYSYVKAHSSKLTLDLNQKDSIAYNKFALKEIYLGVAFFAMDPLDAIGILLHEARHSSPQDPGHTFCNAGDIPKSQGGCDSKFLMSPDAGAYSYYAVHALSLNRFARNLSKADREMGLVNGLRILGTRFNELPQALARQVDVLAVLTENSEVHLVHPFLHTTQKLELPLLGVGEKPTRLEFLPSQGGLYIFTNKNKLWTWSTLKGMERYQKKVLSDEIEIMDVSRMKLPYGEGPKVNLRFKGQKLKYLDYLPMQADLSVVDYPKDRGRAISFPFPEMHRGFMSLGVDTTWVTKDGRVYFPPTFGSDPVLRTYPIFESEVPWISGTGGVVYNELYLWNSEGELKRIDYEHGESITDEENRIYSIVGAEIGLGLHTKKYVQGLKIEVVLTKDGEIHVGKYGSREVRKLNLGTKILDVASAQHSEFTAAVALSTPSRSEFKEKCEILSELPDPWLGTGMGFNGSGVLMMGSGLQDDPCRAYSRNNLEDVTPYYDAP